MKPSTIAIQLALTLTILILLITSTQSKPASSTATITSQAISKSKFIANSEEGLVWRNQLCTFLCSHNEGGDLCKCDLIPLHPEVVLTTPAAKSNA